MQKLAWLLLFSWFFSGCFTPRKEEEIRQDIFNLQGRLLQVERGTKERSEVGNRKQAAVAQTEIERLSRDIQQLRGDIDALRVGVVTGEMPGTDPEKGSVAQTLNTILARLDAIEAAQAELGNGTKKTTAEISAPPATALAAKAKTKGGMDTIEGLQAAFDSKKFAQVIEAAPQFVSESKASGQREQALFLLSESYFKVGKLRDAALKFNELIEKFPGSTHLVQSKMRMGDCFRHLGDMATAKLYYQDLVTKHADTEQAAKAKERLADLDKTEKGGAQKRSPGKKLKTAHATAKPKPKTGKQATRQM